MKFDDASGILFRLGRKYGFRPDLPIGMEDLFRSTLDKFTDDPSMVQGWLEERLPGLFPSLAERPRWLQEPEWPLHREQPMIFIGQLDRRIDAMEVSFYLFKDRSSGVTKVVTQVVGIV